MTKRQAAVLIALVAAGTYANALGNGFAMDDERIVRDNPTVVTPDLERALLAPYWPDAQEGSGLYRPVVTTSFALEWRLFGGLPAGFHLVSVLVHIGVSLLVLALLARFVGVVPAFAGALLFAVHPVHVEAVANVVGRSELYAAAAVLAACILYLRGEAWDGRERPAGLGALCLLYLVGIGSKEIAVVLPGLFLLLELGRPSSRPLNERLRRGASVYLALAGVLALYLVLRTAVLGSTVGEVPAPWLRGIDAPERILTALSLWPEYVRLLLFPVDLASDYAPNVVRVPARIGDALFGASVLVGLLVAALWGRRRALLVSLGIGWFVVSVLPVSNLVLPAGMLMAERTLYLPSVGLSFGVAFLAARIRGGAPTPLRRTAATAGVVAVAVLMVRSVVRNPTWLDSYTVVNELAVDHPESFVSLRARASGLARAGDVEGARALYRAALDAAPGVYGLLVEVAEFHGSRGELERAVALLGDAVRVRPDGAEAYMLLSEYRIRQGRGREGHRLALEGLVRAGPRRELYALLSESYVANGDFEGAARARLAALGLASDSSADWRRLAELYEAMGRPEEARDALARAGGSRAVEGRVRAPGTG